MLVIDVRVPVDRGHLARVWVNTGLFSSTEQGWASACAAADLAAKNGNPSCDPLRPWGHPPAGGYQLIAHGPTPAECVAEYGRHLLVFQPVSGKALDAEAFGRLTLLAYSGALDKKKLLRRTQGGLRFNQGLFDHLLKQLEKTQEIALMIREVRRAPWWELWGRLHLFPISAEGPRFRAPPLDEASLAAALSAGKRRAIPASTVDRDTDDDRFGSSSSSSSSSGSGGGYAGRGGEYGGGGASGSWDGGAPSGAGRGVDSSGRVVAAAAALAAAGTLQAADDSGGSSGAVDTSTGTSY